jgi:hypothetical protein
LVLRVVVLGVVGAVGGGWREDCGGVVRVVGLLVLVLVLVVWRVLLVVLVVVVLLGLLVGIVLWGRQLGVALLVLDLVVVVSDHLGIALVGVVGGGD